MKLKNILLAATAVTMFAVNLFPVNADTIFKSDVNSATDSSSIISIDGTYLLDSKAIIDRVNEIRLEACREGVQNPGTGSPLTEADYVPVKWSSDLEYIAKIRASESYVTDHHIRTNGSSCFNLKSPSGIRSSAEVLAWGSFADPKSAINLWYREKKDWVNKTGKVTGHYTSLINPKNIYFGMGFFDPDVLGWSCAAGEFSTDGSHTETPSSGKLHGTQLLELANSSVADISSLSGATNGNIGETTKISATVTSGDLDYLKLVESYGWSSSNPSVATVNKNGEVNGLTCGDTTISLSINGKTSSVTYTVNHDYTDWKTTVAPGCETTGSKTRSCNVCHFTETKVIPANGHQFEEIEYIAPTCEKDGYSIKRCKICSYEKETVLSATGHVHTKKINEISATCIKEGYSGDTVCTDCNKTIETGSVIPKTAHTEVIKNQKKASCTVGGYSGDVYCSVCNAKLRSGENTSATGHKFGPWVLGRNATTEKEGYYTRSCYNCFTTQFNYTPKLQPQPSKESNTASGSTSSNTSSGNATSGNVSSGAPAASPSTGSTTDTLISTGRLNETNFPLKVKQSAKLTVTGMAAGDYVASWRSSDVNKVTVDRNGKVTGKKKGTATITCVLARGKVLTAKVTVQSGQVKTKKLTVDIKNIKLNKGQSCQLSVTKAPFTSQQGISYSSKNKKIATVSKSGRITAKKAGTTTIYVKSGSKKIAVKITVQGTPVSSLTSNKTDQLVLKKGRSFTWKVKKAPANADDKITYTSSNKKVATVNKNGKITGKKKGTATITVKAGGKKISIKISVN